MKYPDYGNLGDHTETVQVDYDPRRVTYADLLDIFWKSHRPTERSWSRQYMNAIFYHDQRQRDLAMASKARMEKAIGRTVHTQVIPVETFYRAEDYHQKYLLNRHPRIAKAYARIYPHKKDYVDSTAVARVNGYVGGHGSLEQLRRELPDLGLGPELSRTLEELVAGKKRGWFN